MLMVLIIYLSSSWTWATGGPIVNTTYGPVQGMIKQYHGEDVVQFKRIPYAAPPIGKLRFEKPVRHKNWVKVLNATTFGPSCTQNLLQNDAWLLENADISEDCLHLNLYVPRGIDKMARKAVMVWIHGGGFTAGQGILYDGSYLALRGDVIVVTINYRLGLLGFLSTEDTNAVGNYGIWDQKMAFEWVHKNAENFGGDKQRITIFGESAGGYSVGLHTIIPSNKGYFQRAISQSGAVYSPRALASDSKRVSMEAGKLLDCPISNTSLLIDCLRTKPAMDILKIQNAAMSGWDKAETFVSRLGPVIDGTLIVGNPVDLLKDRNSDSYKFFQTLDIMAGTNSAEGGLMYWSMMNYQNKYNFNISDGIPKDVLCEVLAIRASNSYFGGNNEVAQAICDQYGVQGHSLAEQGRSAVNVYADLQFIIPTIKTLMAHTQGNQTRGTYQYIFTHQPKYPWIQSRPPWLQGANHAGEVPFVFGLEAMYPTTHEKPLSELSLSGQMMTYWTSFAKSGNPNSDNLTEWPTFDHISRSYMNLTENSEHGRRLYQDRVNFWTEEIPAIASSIVNTTNGPVRGVVKYVKGSPIVQFKGIPYAMPPVGSRRFAKPVPHTNWGLIYNATKFGPACVQKLNKVSLHLLENKDISEDCLHLNIYVPHSIDHGIKRAVMIWIHGGGYVNGQGQLYDGSYIAVHGNVIVVTINYRLGMLGFLSTKDESALGNYGLWDQKLAIKWVYDNAESFGGDINRITLFGESAGGYSVGLQTIIPSNKGYFKRAILESGTQLSPRALAMDARRVATEASKLLNCSVESTNVLVECLRQKKAADLLRIQDEAAYSWDKTENIAMRLGPVIDGDLIPGNPHDLLDDTKSESFKFFRGLDVIAGTNSDEGGLMLSRLYKYQNPYNFNVSAGIPRDVLCKVIAPSVARTFFNNESKVSEAICKFYGTLGMTLAEQGRKALAVYADLLFIIPTTNILEVHSEEKTARTGNSYQYIFTHTPSNAFRLPQWITGPSHGQEVSFVFGANALQNKSSNEANISELMMRYWSNFAKTGNPNQDSSGDVHIEALPFWPNFDKDDEAFMNFTETSHSEKHLYSDRVTFWTETIMAQGKDVTGPPRVTSTDSNRDTNSVFKICSSFGLLILTSGLVYVSKIV